MQPREAQGLKWESLCRTQRTRKHCLRKVSVLYANNVCVHGNIENFQKLMVRSKFKNNEMIDKKNGFTD